MTTPDSVDTRIGTLKFERACPTEETMQKVYDKLDFSRAVEAYMWAYPAASFQAIQIGPYQRDLGVDLNGIGHLRKLGRRPSALSSPPNDSHDLRHGEHRSRREGPVDGLRCRPDAHRRHDRRLLAKVRHRPRAYPAPTRAREANSSSCRLATRGTLPPDAAISSSRGR